MRVNYSSNCLRAYCDWSRYVRAHEARRTKISLLEGPADGQRQSMYGIALGLPRKKPAFFSHRRAREPALRTNLRHAAVPQVEANALRRACLASAAHQQGPLAANACGEQPRYCFVSNSRSWQAQFEGLANAYPRHAHWIPTKFSGRCQRPGAPNADLLASGTRFGTLSG